MLSFPDAYTYYDLSLIRWLYIKELLRTRDVTSRFLLLLVHCLAAWHWMLVSVRRSPWLSCLAGGKIQLIESLRSTWLRVCATAVFLCVLATFGVVGRVSFLTFCEVGRGY